MWQQLDYSVLADEELTYLLREGDENAFAQIFERYDRLLFLHVYRRLGNREEAQDIIQDLFSSLWQNKQQLEDIVHLKGYLFTAVRNRIFKLIARRKLESAYVISLQQYLDSGAQAADHLVRHKLMLELVDKEIAMLPLKMREVFELSRYAGLSHREIGEKLGISEQTVKKQVQNALKILKIKLGSIFYIIFL